MPALILQSCVLGSRQVWYLSGLDFIHKGIRYTITATESTGPEIYDVSHTVKNISSRSYSQIQMKRLIQILLDSD
ncbi:MAG: hypothetical protein ACOYMF_14350 [Bacteroidales bacterium]